MYKNNTLFFTWRLPLTFHYFTLQGCVLRISSVDFWTPREILKHFKKKFMEKDQKLLIENRFWNFDRKNSKIFRDSKFSIFLIFNEKLNFSMKNSKFQKFSIFRFFKKIEIFKFSLKIQWKFRVSKIFENFPITISKSIFDQKKLVFFHELFLKVL